MKTYSNRNEVPEKYKWDLTDFYENEEKFLEDLKKCNDLIEKADNYKCCTKDSRKLYDFLKFYENVNCKCDNLYVYSYLINDQELGKKESIERINKVINLSNIVSQNLSFFEPELLELNQKDYDSLFEDNKKLLEYKNFLDTIYRKKGHVLSQEKEVIVSELINSVDNFAELSSNLVNNEHNFGKIRLNDGTIEEIAVNNIWKFLKNSDRNIRKKVYKSFYKKIGEYSGTSAGLLSDYVKMNNSLAKIYNFKNPWEEKLFELNVDNNVFENLIKVVENNTKVLQKFYTLKKEILGYDKLYFYDKSVNLNKNKKEYTIEEAQNLIKEALKPLGSDYLSKFEKIIKNRYIDYCQYKGKCSGGYSYSSSTTNSKILMSFNGELDSVSTIAHESGHNVHDQYLKENNPIQYRGQALMICEIASLTNELLLSHYIVKNSKNKEEKLEGLENIINVIVSNLFGAVREGKIEQEMYQYVYNGGTLTKEYMQELVDKSLKKYYGSSVTTTKIDRNSWVLRSHYFNNFYLYNYAISISVATNIAQKIFNNEDNMAEKYIEFLKTGDDTLPLDTLKKLNIELTNDNVYKSAIDYFENLINQFEKIYKGSE